MRRLLLLAALAIATVPISVAIGCFDAGPAGAGSSQQRARQVEEHFAIQFCYGQYRNQNDVLRCLAQAL
jgi:hypothetical protein